MESQSCVDKFGTFYITAKEKFLFWEGVVNIFFQDKDDFCMLQSAQLV